MLSPMSEHALLHIAALMILGIGATWLASLLRIPSILLLLVTGFLIGPATGLVCVLALAVSLAVLIRRYDL